MSEPDRRRGVPPPARLNRPSAAGFAVLVTLAAFLLVSLAQVAPSPERLIEGAPRMVDLVGRMMPPNLEPAFLARVFWRIVETLQIAFVGTVIGVVISLPIAWLAARRLSPLGPFNVLARALIALFRTVPDLVWALLFVAAVGLGAVAGTMTIIVDTIGFCGRFFAEAMEDAEEAPQEALTAIGAGKLAILVSAVIPDALPSMINSSLFALEKAVRSSVVLGLVGAGGIGQELKVAFDLFQYPNASSIMIAIFAIVLVMEQLTDRLRERVR
ncbi:MAG: phosphonate ABC transporter, permease protein PhnE [Geminicoccaceae bacterium]